MDAKEAGRRLVLLSLPFAGFGLLWVFAPPLADRLDSSVLRVMQALGWALVALSLGAIGFGAWLVAKDEERIL